MFRALLPGLVLLGTTLPGSARPATQGGNPSGIELGWLESFLMTSEERRASIEARTRGDLASFRRLFWLRRDPDPATPGNETLDRFLTRIRLANRNFLDNTGDDGGGDRARVFVLLGMPLQTIPEPATPTQPEGIRWVWPADPGAGLGDDLSALFFPDPDGRLWIENRAEVDEALEEMRRRLIVRKDIGYQRGEDGRLALPDLPGGGSDRARRVLSGFDPDHEPRGIPFSVTSAFFRAGNGATRIALLLEARNHRLAPGPDGQAAASVFARVVASLPGEDPSDTAYTTILAADRPTRFEIALTTKPGARRVILGFTDEQSDDFGVAALTLPVPAFPLDAPGFSSVVLYSDAEPSVLPEGSPERAFQFGRTRFHPRPTGVFRQQETLGAFYFFYPGERKDDGELPEIVAEYTIRREGGDAGFIAPEAVPTSMWQAAANAEFPLAGFAPGRYELAIRVRYREDAFETSQSFTLVR